MKQVTKYELKKYCTYVLFTVLLFGSVLDVLLSTSNFRDGLDLYKYEQVYASTSNSGFNWFTNAIDISLGVAGSYQDIDLSSHIPSSSTGAIINVLNTNSGADYSSFIRHPDSTDDYYADVDRDAHEYVYVGVNSSRYIEGKIESTDVDYYLIGYTDSAVTFLVDGVDVSTATTGSYVDTDLSGSVPAGSSGAIFFVDSTSTYDFSIRHPDSSDDFYGREFRHNLYCLAGVNSSRYVQQKIENAGVDLYVIGYCDSTITFKTDWVDISLGTTSAWTEIDVTASTSADANGLIVMMDNSWISSYQGTIRAKGSTDDRSADSDITSHDSKLFAGVELDSDEVFEGWIEDLNTDFYIVAYMEETVTAGVYPDHVEDSYLVTNATHTLVDNSTYGVFASGGWIELDYGSQVANVTAINWDLMYSVTGSLWRIEISTDAVTWTVVAQTIQNDVGSPPPASTNSYWTRYDSETNGRFRYVRVSSILGAGGTWYLDSVWLTVSPPTITYDDGTYAYPSTIQYWEWNTNIVTYRTSPYTWLGANDTITAGPLVEMNHSSLLLNIDYDPDNYVIVKFHDYYNITSAQVHARQPTSSGHFYLYISTTGASGNWTLVGDWSGVQTAGWYGASINATRIRYMKVNCTAYASNYIYIESFRVAGSIHSGSGTGGGVTDDFTFINIPDYLDDLLGIGLAGSQFFASMIVLSAFLLPIAVYDRKGIIALIVGMVVLGFCVLIGWLPTWIMLLIALLVAGIFAFNFSRWFGGR